MIYYDETAFVEQAIHSSLQEENHLRDEETEFNRMVNQTIQ